MPGYPLRDWHRANTAPGCRRTGRDAPATNQKTDHDIRVATCALFVEIARIDETFTQAEMEKILSIVKGKYGLAREHADALLEEAEKEADVIVWDGGNNDTPFYFPDVHIVIFDPHRAGHETLYYPGETNMLMADIAVINKVDSAATDKVNLVRKNIETYANENNIWRSQQLRLESIMESELGR